jgi:UDP:flavonoid glycosyltransferase YjiC (YdhE family)
LFVYAGSELPHLDTLVQGLVGMDIEVVAYLRGDVGPLPHFLKHRGHEVFDSPPPLDQVLPRVSHLLSQGGAFSCCAAVAAGRPHLVMPQHNETELNFAHVAAMGIARRLDPVADEKVIRRKLNDFLTDTMLARHARHWALTLSERRQKDGLSAAMEAIERCLARDQIRNSRLRSAAAAAHPS